ncbi:MAG: heavy-metal-associated domain-containing protein [Ferruginibacter sp.]
MKPSTMKLFILMCLVVALTLTACAQETKKTEPAPPTEQTKTALMRKVKIPIDGMVCMACQSTVKKAIKSLNGVRDVEISLEDKNALITYYPNLVKPEQFQKAINGKGYTAGQPQEVQQ